ncbi:MAG: TetR/AcrR family transcriptional regulator [Brevibacterium sp.]|uniref:TetR/AcrR family transcriptional regulator n=1 Tax=Brevibacterium sandarakinum TaxID=629680 RepID=UPI00264BF60E|nr:TetR/AcrR family transcriptional regulator [Brevibacterium sandarakinum]MDN5587350.1 TetR/AcrR family transcriptional regulator [Brevibacterium sp.]MDN5635235.1 TetR/AcrR family transcriptional regulator [Brevibacterium sp.]MDN5658018.1 TetR/AcrR family transcriptional regulator [Brevibacterium sandarakinum]
MARNSTDTKEKLLDAFEILLDEHGISGATLDAVAAKAGVSKGGLLYHFGSKADLIKGSLERLGSLVDDDVESMKSAGDRLHLYYLETSAEVGTPLDRSLIAAERLAQENAEAKNALRKTREAWFDVLNNHLGDPDMAMTIQLIGDGMYFNQNFGLSQDEALTHVKNVLGRLGL